MDDKPGWTRLDWPGPEDPDFFGYVRQWEEDRLFDEAEWSLVALTSGETYERRGTQFKATFTGFTAGELQGALLSHTHVRGLPPSGPDIVLLLELPQLSQFRVARKAKQTIVLRRQKSIGRIEAALLLREVHLRVTQRGALSAEDVEIALIFWLELQTELGELGIEWLEEEP
jgi:hypothetical protein